MGQFPDRSIRMDLPALTTNQMIEVDRAMIEDYHIKLSQMMANAGRCLADLARRRFLGKRPTRETLHDTGRQRRQWRRR